jgi:hypothetical protein
LTTFNSAMRGVPVDLIPAGTSATGAGTAIAIPPSFTKHKFRIITSVGVASGAVQPESADNPAYSGTWNPIGGGPITVPAASSELEIEFEGRFSSVRANITTIIGGGTIEVQYEGVP